MGELDFSGTKVANSSSSDSSSNKESNFENTPGKYGYCNDPEKYRFQSITQRLLPFIRLNASGVEVSRETIEDKLFPSDGQDELTDYEQQYWHSDWNSRHWLTSRARSSSKLYTHPNLWNGIDVVGYRIMHESPESVAAALYFIEVKESSLDINANRNRPKDPITGKRKGGSSMAIKVREPSADNMLERLVELRAGGIPRLNSVGKYITPTSAHGYFCFMFTKKDGDQLVSRDVYFTRAQHIMYDEDGASRLRETAGTAPYYLVTRKHLTSLIEKNILVLRKDADLFTKNRVYVPKGACLPELNLRLPDSLEQRYEYSDSITCFGQENDGFDDIPFDTSDIPKVDYGDEIPF